MADDKKDVVVMTNPNHDDAGEKCGVVVDDMAGKQQQYFLAFDPGVKNLAVWAGILNDEPSIVPKTLKLVKIDLTEMKRSDCGIPTGHKHSRRHGEESCPKISKTAASKLRMPLYEAASKLVLDSEWMRDGSSIRAAIVETQAPRNVVSRVIAATIYGTLRGLGVNVKFSSSRAKNSVMEALSQETGYNLVQKPTLNAETKLTKKESAGRRRTLHRINKINSEGLIRHVLSKCGDDTTLKLLDDGRKADDMADAIMLGISLAIEHRRDEAKSVNPHKREKKRQHEDDGKVVVVKHAKKQKDENAGESLLLPD